jgi:HPt (histidine-containing phosphotransfer) domain-containing protein
MRGSGKAPRGLSRGSTRRMKPLSRIVEELVPAYLEARKKDLPQMRELLVAGDFERLRILSHSLKGSGGSFGFPELTRFGGALERYASESDGAGFQAELGRLSDYLEHLDWSPSSK